MDVDRIAAFATDGAGGNPAGVWIGDTLPDAAQMQEIARVVGYSETAFAAPKGAGWQVRYFAPEAEVAFCGHATIALGAALGRRQGAGIYPLHLTGGEISVEAMQDGDTWRAALQSPPTRSGPLDAGLRARLMNLLGLVEGDLDPALAPLLANAGNDHPVFLLRRRDRLAAMDYPFEPMRALMAEAGLTTVALLVALSPDEFAARNVFAVGGVVEDAATGAAAAALGGALVDVGWRGLAGGGTFRVRQGEDMGAPSLLEVQVSGVRGASVRVSGAVRWLA